MTGGEIREIMRLSLRDVQVTLGAAAARVHVLRGIDLNIGHGEAVGIVGPSGSGKSTLLMVMAGLEQAESGSVSVIGQELSRLSEDALARFRGAHVGVVFQAFHLIPTMTALENVAIPLDLAGTPNAEHKAREDELALVGLGRSDGALSRSAVRWRAAARGAGPCAGRSTRHSVRR
jgi:putative ABC transport system ATP-binding protein